jgi:membrane protein YqaA with SNARE-associated domain
MPFRSNVMLYSTWLSYGKSITARAQQAVVLILAATMGNSLGALQSVLPIIWHTYEC